MKINRLTILAVGGLALVGCMQPGVDLDAERAALQAAADAYHTAGSAADTSTVASLYTSDAVTLPQGEGVVAGPDAMGDFAEAFTSAPGFSMRFENVIVDIGAGGDMGYTQV